METFPRYTDVEGYCLRMCFDHENEHFAPIFHHSYEFKFRRNGNWARRQFNAGCQYCGTLYYKGAKHLKFVDVPQVTYFNLAFFRCPFKCIHCHKQGPTCEEQDGDITIHCGECNLEFPSTDCYQEHLRNLMCKRRWVVDVKSHKHLFRFRFFCRSCQKIIFSPTGKHTCGTAYCQRCKDTLPYEHNCYFSRPSESRLKAMRNKTQQMKYVNI